MEDEETQNSTIGQSNQSPGLMRLRVAALLCDGSIGFAGLIGVSLGVEYANAMSLEPMQASLPDIIFRVVILVSLLAFIVFSYRLAVTASSRTSRPSCRLLNSGCLLEANR